MTPLAHAIAKQQVLPPKKRKPLYMADTKEFRPVGDIVHDIHCFECSQILDLVHELVDSGKVKDVDQDTIFLPAPRTWIEYRYERGARHAWFLEESAAFFTFLIVVEGEEHFLAKRSEYLSGEDGHLMHGMLIATLALINTPKIIGRDQHLPNRGLERSLQKQSIGKYPLHAWNELKLRVAKPIEIDDGEPHEDHLTGRRALHFCRAHLRIKLGKIEHVTSHWRGDAALGIKQTRYRVEG